jgi:hypothetical protein
VCASNAPGIIPAHEHIQELDAGGFCPVAGNGCLEENFHIGFGAKRVVPDVASGEMKDNTILCIGSDNGFFDQAGLPVRNGIRVGDIETFLDQDSGIGLEQSGVFRDPEIKAHKAIKEKRPPQEDKNQNGTHKKHPLLFSISILHEEPVQT